MVDLSVMIPARDAGKTLFETLESIVKYIPDNLNYEILVGNHLSEDDTIEEFGRFQEKLYGDIALTNEPVAISIVGVDAPETTVGYVRNVLAKYAQGAYFLFLDADTCLTPAWKDACAKQFEGYDLNGFAVPHEATSSVPLVPFLGWNSSWVWENWFKYFAYGCKGEKVRFGGYLRGAHILLHREMFHSAGGFNESLVTGEDVDLSNRLAGMGVKIRHNPGMVVTHGGYPKTLKTFFKREVWHGIGDFQSADTFGESAVAQVATIFALQLPVFLFALFADWRLAVISLLALVLIPLTMSLKKFKGLSPVSRFNNWLICNVYLTARATSFFFRGHKRRLA